MRVDSVVDAVLAIDETDNGVANVGLGANVARGAEAVLAKVQLL